MRKFSIDKVDENEIRIAHGNNNIRIIQIRLVGQTTNGKAYLYENGNVVILANSICTKMESGSVVGLRDKYRDMLTECDKNSYKTTSAIRFDDLKDATYFLCGQEVNDIENKWIDDKGNPINRYFVEDNSETKEASIDEKIAELDNERDRLIKQKEAKEALIEKQKADKEREEENNNIMSSRIRSIKDFKKIKLPEKCSLKDLLTILFLKKAFLMQGAPGTGKTTAMQALAKIIVGADDLDNCDRYALCTFSPGIDRENFIDGYVANENGNWVLKDGILKRICNAACKDKDHNYVLLIDEISRGNAAKTLAEFLTAVENRGTEVVTIHGTKLVVPENLYILATMNTQDRHTKDLDEAIKSRFAIINMNGVVNNKLNANEILEIRGDYSNNESYNMNDDEAKDVIRFVCNNKEIIKERKFDDKYNEKLNELINLVYDVNILLKKDPARHEENVVGLRQLCIKTYTTYQLGLVFKWCLEPEIRSKCKNLTEESDRIENLIKEAEKEFEIISD